LKKSELFKHQKKIRDWLLATAQHHLSSERLGVAKKLIRIAEDLDNLMDEMRFFCIDYMDSEKSSSTE